jgi:outer membrane protein assembly factor BamB
MSVTSDSYVLVSLDGKVRALNAASGEELWSLDTGMRSDDDMFDVCLFADFLVHVY